jgi:hypothetical protein
LILDEFFKSALSILMHESIEIVGIVFAAVLVTHVDIFKFLIVVTV